MSPYNAVMKPEQQETIGDLSYDEQSGLPPHVRAMLAHASHQLMRQQQDNKGPKKPIPKQVIAAETSPPAAVSGPNLTTNRQPTTIPDQDRLEPSRTAIIPVSAPQHFELRRGQHEVAVQRHVGSLHRDIISDPQINVAVPYQRYPRGGDGRGYSPHGPGNTRFGDQQSDPRRRAQLQINYLESLALDIPSLESVADELRSKEAFRVRLVEIAQKALSELAKSRGLSIGANAIDLKCFGSLRNGFALPGADLDLTMITRAQDFPEELQLECPRVLERAFLNAGLGARLIPNARIPIIKICGNPSESLVQAFKAELDLREEDQTSREFGGGQDLPQASNVTGDDPGRNNSSREDMVGVEFPSSGVGVQCDLNFSGRLALYNSELLRCYSLCDERVRLVGLFVKQWAKARKINDPYHGTLSSYGYILMVIHYLTNVASPPVCPNLQIIYRPPPPGRGQKEVTSVDGCDVRFFHDEAEIKARSSATAWNRTGNRQPVGELLRGFFAYYAIRGRNLPLGGFDWVNGVVSIRTRGGIRAKSEKDWTRVKYDPSGKRNNYLLAIEDPFELDHNVARPVFQAGMRAIRDEFWRAHNIINRVQEIPGVGWEWRTDDGEVGEDFFAAPTDTRLSAFNKNQTPRWDKRHAVITSPDKESGEPKLAHGTSAVRSGAHRIDEMLVPLSLQ
jgi:DNA polymerase sigma